MIWYDIPYNRVGCKVIASANTTVDVAAVSKMGSDIRRGTSDIQ